MFWRRNLQPTPEPATQLEQLLDDLSELTGVAWRLSMIEQADRYDRAADVCGFGVGILLAAAAWLVLPSAQAASDSYLGYPVHFKVGLMAILLLSGTVFGCVAASHRPVVRRLFCSRTEQARRTEQSARQAFTAARSALDGEGLILIHHSAFERRLSVMCDAAAQDALPRDLMPRFCRQAREQLTQAEPARAITTALEPLARELSNSRPTLVRQAG